MLPQLVEDLLHLERGRDRLDQHRGPDRPARDAQEVLGQVERVVPEPRLEVALVLGQVEVGALARVELALRARRHVQREVGQGARGPHAVDQDVLLVQVPAARADHDRGQFPGGPQRVVLALGGAEVDRPVQRVHQVELAGDHVVPQRGIRVLEVGQPDLRPGVEGVDGHLHLGRAGDLHPAVGQPGRRRRDPPVRVLADVRGLRQEVQHGAAGQLGLAAAARGEQLGPARAELGVQRGDQVDGLRRQDLVVTIAVGARDLHTFGSRHVGAPPRVCPTS